MASPNHLICKETRQKVRCQAAGDWLYRRRISLLQRRDIRDARHIGQQEPPSSKVDRRLSEHESKVGRMSQSGQSGAERNSSRPVSTAFAMSILVACVVGLVLLVKGLYPADLPPATSPDFIDNIFDNRAVVWAARLLLVSAAAVLAFGGIFIVVSIGIRMKNREWLRRAGPFEISETAVSEIEGQLDFWRQAALAGQEEVAELTERLEESDELIEQLHTMVDDG